MGWQQIGNIRGPAGQDGATGQDGPEGPQGPPGLSVAYRHHIPFSLTADVSTFTVVLNDPSGPEAIGSYIQRAGASAGGEHTFAALPFAMGLWELSGYHLRNTSYGRLHVVLDDEDTGTYLEGFNAGGLDRRVASTGNQEFAVDVDGLHKLSFQVLTRHPDNTTGFAIAVYWVDLRWVGPLP